MEKGLDGENLPITKDELQQLIQLLSISDESDWANFVLDSQSLNLDEDLTLLVEENFETFNLPSMVSTLLKSVNPEKDGLDSTLFLEEIENFETHLPEMNHAEAIASFLQILSFVNIDQIDLPIDQILLNK